MNWERCYTIAKNYRSATIYSYGENKQICCTSKVTPFKGLTLEERRIEINNALREKGLSPIIDKPKTFEKSCSNCYKKESCVIARTIVYKKINIFSCNEWHSDREY